MQRVAASEQERINTPAVWLGHKKCRPAKTNLRRRGWSLEEITEGSYVCFQAEETSEYFDNAGYLLLSELLLRYMRFLHAQNKAQIGLFLWLRALLAKHCKPEIQQFTHLKNLFTLRW